MSGEGVFLPRSAGGRTPSSVRIGVMVETPEGGEFCDLGSPEQFNWWWDPETKVMSIALIAGQLGGVAPPTKVTAGVLREDGKEIAGDLAEVLRVVPRTSLSDGSTRTRADEIQLDPKTGLAVLRGDTKVHTTEGLGSLDPLLTSAGIPRTEFDREAQDGKVGAAIDSMGRIATWRIDQQGEEPKGLSMPLRIEHWGDLNGWGGASPIGVFRDNLDGQTQTGDARLGVGTFTVEPGPPPKVIQTFPSGLRKIVREGEDFQAPALAALLQGVANQQAQIIATAEALRARAGSLSAEEIKRLQAAEADLVRVNESLSALGAGAAGAAGGQRPPPQQPDGSLENPNSIDVSAHMFSFHRAHAWGTLKPYDLAARAALASGYGQDPRAYPMGRWAPYFCIDIDRLIAPPDPDPQPPPEKKEPPPPFPPPEEDEDDPKDPDPPPPDQHRPTATPPGVDPPALYMIAMPSVMVASDADSYTTGEGALISSPHPGPLDTDGDDANDLGWLGINLGPPLDPPPPPAGCPTLPPGGRGIDHGPGAGAAGGGTVWDPTGTEGGF